MGIFKLVGFVLDVSPLVADIGEIITKMNDIEMLK